MRRIRISAIASVLVLVMLLAVVSAASARKITFWTFVDPTDDGPRSRVQSELIEQFVEQTGIEVETVVVYWADIPSDLIRATAAGVGPDVVRITLPRSWERLIEADVLLPIDQYSEWTDEDKSDWLQPWSVTTHNGSKMSIPIEHRVLTLWVNPEHLAEVEETVPVSWDDLGRVAAKLTENGYVGFTAGLSRRGEGAAFFEWFESAYYGLGKHLIDEDGFVTWNCPEGYRAIETYYDLVHKYKAIPESVLSWDLDDEHRAYLAGKVSMMILGTHRVFTTLDAGVNVEVYPVPGYIENFPSPHYTSGWHLAISKDSKDPEAAAEFIRFMTSTNAQILNAKVAGELPSRHSAYADPWFVDSEEGKEMMRWKEIIANYGVDMRYAEDVLAMRHSLLDAVEEIVLRGAPIKETLDEAARNFNQSRQR